MMLLNEMRGFLAYLSHDKEPEYIPETRHISVRRIGIPSVVIVRRTR